eukprot:m.229079 g.229079  ORF g.229079 m.229079 type:complete len:82 (+) comp17656_c0_seq1:2338-2583(+)
MYSGLEYGGALPASGHPSEGLYSTLDAGYLMFDADELHAYAGPQPGFVEGEASGEALYSTLPSDYAGTSVIHRSFDLFFNS